MQSTKTIYMLLGLILFTTVPTDTRSDDGIRLAVGVVGGIAGAVGLYSAYNWLFAESDEEALDDARRSVMCYKNKYRHLFNTLGADAQHAISTGQTNRFVDYLNEQILYELAKLKHNKAAIIVYRNQIDHVLRDLHASHKNLSKRLIEPESLLLRNQMQYAVDELRELLREAELLVSVLSKHQSYFELYDAEAKFGFKYDEELRVLANYSNNLDNQAWAIRQFVVARAKTSSLPFARIEYRKILDRDIDHLESVFNKSSRHYAVRMGNMRQLIDTLKTIKSFVVTDMLYPQEAADYQRDQREKERIRIEREKADAERRKAEAEERKARAESERVLIEQQKLHEQRKENWERQQERFDRDRARAERGRAERYGY